MLIDRSFFSDNFCVSSCMSSVAVWFLIDDCMKIVIVLINEFLPDPRKSKNDAMHQIIHSSEIFFLLLCHSMEDFSVYFKISLPRTFNRMFSFDLFGFLTFTESLFLLKVGWRK